MTFDKIADLVVGPLFTVLLLLTIWISTRVLDRRRFIDLGFRLDARWLRDLVVGFLAAACMMTLLFAVAASMHWVEVRGMWRGTPGLPVGLAVAYTILKVLCVGTYEEALSRGYQLRNVAEGLNGVARLRPTSAVLASVAVTSAVFGVLHLTNDNATLLSAVLLSINGVMFSVPVILTGQLGAAIGLHIGWNLFQGLVFGFPVSGDDLEPASVLIVRGTGPDWITGGAFGPEAGLLSLGVTVIGIAALYMWFRRAGYSTIRADIAEYSSRTS